MDNRNILFGVIGLLILAVIGLAVDRSNQITTLTEQAENLSADAQSAADDFEATIAAQVGELDSQSEIVTAAELDLSDLQTQVAVSSTEFEDQIAELESANDVLESANSDFVTQVAELETDVEDAQNDAINQAATATFIQGEAVSQANNAATQAAVAATAVEDAMMMADLAATSEAQSIAIQADVIAQADIAATSEALAIIAQEELLAENEALSTQIAELQPTATPTAEPTIVAEVGELDILWEVDIDGTGMVNIAPDSATVAVLRADDVIEFLSSEDGSSQRELTDLAEGIQSFAFSNGGRLIAAVADFSQIVVFDASSGVVELEEAIRNPIKAYPFAGDDGAIAIQTGLETEIFTFEDAPRVTRIGGVDLDWSDDGAIIASTDGSTIEFLAMDGYQIDSTTTVETDSNSILMIEFSPDSGYLAGFTAEGMVMVWRAGDGEMVWTVETGADIDGFAWSGDSEHLAVVSGGQVIVYSADGVSTTSTAIEGATAVDWSADSAFLVVASEDTVWAISAESFAG